jgi:hypothetical protein
MTSRFTESQREVLARLAKRYVWWESPEQARRFPQRVIAHVMNVGDWDDVCTLVGALGNDPLREALETAVIGQLSPRSWSYWHYRLGLIAPGASPPPMPSRRTA